MKGLCRSATAAVPGKSAARSAAAHRAQRQCGTTEGRAAPNQSPRSMELLTGVYRIEIRLLYLRFLYKIFTLVMGLASNSGYLAATLLPITGGKHRNREETSPLSL